MPNTKLYCIIQQHHPAIKERKEIMECVSVLVADFPAPQLNITNNFCNFTVLFSVCFNHHKMLRLCFICFSYRVNKRGNEITFVQARLIETREKLDFKHITCSSEKDLVSTELLPNIFICKSQFASIVGFRHKIKEVKVLLEYHN